MTDTTSLHVLGCVPSLLEVLFELAHAARGLECFVILKNIPVDIPAEYVPKPRWSISEVECYESSFSRPEDAAFAFSVVGSESKPRVFEYFSSGHGVERIQFPHLIHPSSVVSPSAAIDHGLQIEELSTISAATKVGFGVHIKRGCNVGHHCVLEDYVTINPGVSISGHVRIGRTSMIGTGASIRDGVNIGKNCLIGVGSAVVEDIPDNSIAFGNPCRVRGSR